MIVFEVFLFLIGERDIPCYFGRLLWLNYLMIHPFQILQASFSRHFAIIEAENRSIGHISVFIRKFMIIIFTVQIFVKLFQSILKNTYILPHLLFMLKYIILTFLANCHTIRLNT